MKMYNYVIEPLVLEKFRPLPNLMLTFLIALMPLTEFLQETEKSFLSGFCDQTGFSLLNCKPYFLKTS